jgi:hypothetical protein
MKGAVLASMLLTVAPSAADDFAGRWDALNPPTVEIETDPPMKPRVIRAHARLQRHHFTCHHVWFTRDEHRYWRCQR